MKPEIELKRFDEWEECDCNKCERYWTSQCDGAKVGKAKECKSYIATRRVDIPEEINKINARINEINHKVNWFNVLDIITCIILIGYIIYEVIK